MGPSDQPNLSKILGARRRKMKEQSVARKVPVRNEDTDAEKWVYRFLGNLAAIEANKKAAITKNTAAMSRFNRKRRSVTTRKRPAVHRRLRSPTPYSWDRVATPPRSPISAFQSPTCDSMDELEYQEEHRRHALMDEDNNASPSVVLGEKSYEDPTLLAKINRYIRAGIAEGKRRAQRYVRKALSFAVEAGYLLPADRDGKLLRVSASLLRNEQPSDARGRRRGGAPRRKTSRSSKMKARRTSTRKRKTASKRKHRLQSSPRRQTVPDAMKTDVESQNQPGPQESAGAGLEPVPSRQSRERSIVGSIKSSSARRSSRSRSVSRMSNNQKDSLMSPNDEDNDQMCGSGVGVPEMVNQDHSSLISKPYAYDQC
ncbi:hypothetical protein TKK_0009792 [Trichogramma kaykai]